MREAIPEILWMGNCRDGQDIATILDREIGAVVHLAMEEAPYQFPREIVYCRFPLLDGFGNSSVILKLTIQTVASLIEAKIRTLVTCSGGMSRTPSIVAAALAYIHNESPDDLLKKIGISGPHDVAPALWNDIRKCLGTE